MPELEVRPAAVEDIAAVAVLAADALSRLRELRGGAQLLEEIGLPVDIDADSLAAALCGGSVLGATTLVAVLDDAVVGVAVVVRDERSLDLVGVHTSRSLRRRRIGSVLLSTAEALARAEDTTFEAIALPGDQTVKSLLEAAGYKARLLRMSGDR